MPRVTAGRTSSDDDQSALLPESSRGQSRIKSYGSVGPDVAEETEAHEPRRDDEQEQYAGMPEMRKKMVYIFPALAIGVFLAAADQTIVISSYGTIGSQLGALDKTTWIATAYFLTLTSCQPLYGKLSDVFSRKYCLCFAYFIFGVGCLACGFAQNINQLIAARAFTGIGGAGMTTVVSILLSDVIALKDRGSWQGYINIIYAAGAASGAPLGGAFADSGPAGWRMSFHFQAPLCFVAILLVYCILKMPAKDQRNWEDKLKNVDFVGAFTLIVAVLGIIYALDRGSNLAWRDPITLTSFAIGILVFALFIFVELRIAAEPFAPGRIIFERSLFASYLCNLFSFAGWMATLFYTPLYFQAVKGYSARHSAALLIPNIVAGVSGSLFGGFYMKRTGKFYWLNVVTYWNLVLGLCCVSLCSGLLLSSDLAIIAGLVICGWSNGIGVTSSLISLISNAARNDQAIATACSYLFRSLGNTAGLALTSTVANQVLKSQLRAHLSEHETSEIERRVRESLDYITTLPPATQRAVRSSYEASTRAAFTFDILLALGAAFAALAIREAPLSARH